MLAYLHTKSIRDDGSSHSHLTRSVSVKSNPMPHHKLGLQWTASGYGSRIPTEYMILLHGVWRRVYCICYSNAGTLFIGKKYDQSAIVRIDQE